MRTLVSTFLVGICLAAGPALAQQNPSAPSGMYSVAHGQASQRRYKDLHVVQGSASFIRVPAITAMP